MRGAVRSSSYSPAGLFWKRLACVYLFSHVYPVCLVTIYENRVRSQRNGGNVRESEENCVCIYLVYINLDSFIWAFKHTMRNVADTGLQIFYQLLQNISTHEHAASSFYQTYYTDILLHIFSVVTDSSHTAGLTMHASILAYMFTLVEQNRITVSLDSANPTAASTNNVTFVQGFVANLLKAAFPHLSENQIKIAVQGMVNLNQDIPAFKEHLRDFLVQIREVTGDDDSDLFLEEREATLRLAQEEKRRVQMSVPGILNPHEIPEEMQD